jgi:putative CocE/NonD family hydrolase
VVTVAGSVSPVRAATQGAVEVGSVSIVVRDGVVLDASVAAPAGAVDLPLVVLPGTFAGDLVNVSPVAEAFAERGYAAVSYLERGLGPDGELDGGGPDDVADVSDVITWALDSLPVDPARVGLCALSYGGGIVLQAAAADARVAVVAELAGWTDMGAAFYPNRTPAHTTLQGLAALAATVSNPGRETIDAFAGALTLTDVDASLEYARRRSVAHRTSPSLADRAIPLFMAHEMNETVFPIDAAVDFWESYPGPKRLELRPGDHASQELGASWGSGLSESWRSAMRWFDAYLAGTDTSITQEPALLVVPRSPNGSPPAETGPGLTHSTMTRWYLSSSQRFTPDTRALGSRAPGPGVRIHQGQNWLVHVAVPLWTYAAEAVTGVPPSVFLPAVDRRVSQVWSTEDLSETLSLRGSARVHLELTPTADAGSVVVHLLDLDSTTGYLVAHQPWSWESAIPGQVLVADVSITDNAYDFPPGHRLGVVVTTSDPSYATSNPIGASMLVGAGSWVEIPVR